MEAYWLKSNYYNTNLTENLLIINKITLLQNYEIIKCDNLNNNFYIKAFNIFLFIYQNRDKEF